MDGWRCNTRRVFIDRARSPPFTFTTLTEPNLTYLTRSMSSNPTPQSAPAPAHAPAPSPQRTAHALSLSHPTSFWRSEAAHLSWALAPTSILQTDAGASHRWTWCGDGQISASWNLLGRHVAAGYGDAAALLWESPVTGRGRRVSYTELLEEVVILAGVLAELGVGKGDRVLVYSEFLSLEGGEG